MRLFSKIAFFFNLAFLVTAWMRFVERRDSTGASPLSAWQPVENTLIVMGYTAIFVNLLFNVFFAVRKFSGRPIPVSPWLLTFNIAILILQILYFFVLP